MLRPEEVVSQLVRQADVTRVPQSDDSSKLVLPPRRAVRNRLAKKGYGLLPTEKNSHFRHWKWMDGSPGRLALDWKDNDEKTVAAAVILDI